MLMEGSLSGQHDECRAIPSYEICGQPYVKSETDPLYNPVLVLLHERQ